jgi:hypothetical protein
VSISCKTPGLDDVEVTAIDLFCIHASLKESQIPFSALATDDVDLVERRAQELADENAHEAYVSYISYLGDYAYDAARDDALE